MRLEVRRLCELFTTSVEWTHIRSIASVDSHVSAKIEVETKPFTTSFERALKWFFARVHQLMSFKFGTFDKGFAAFCTHVYPWPVRMQMFTHRTVITEHLRASLMGARDCSLDAIHHWRLADFQLMAGSGKLGKLLRIREIQTRHTV